MVFIIQILISEQISTLRLVLSSNGAMVIKIFCDLCKERITEDCDGIIINTVGVSTASMETYIEIEHVCDSCKNKFFKGIKNFLKDWNR